MFEIKQFKYLFYGNFLYLKIQFVCVYRFVEQVCTRFNYKIAQKQKQNFLPKTMQICLETFVHSTVDAFFSFIFGAF